MAKKLRGHLHIYKRKTLGKNYVVLACVDVVCSHYIPISLAEGKMCLCYHCKEPMIVDKKALLNVKVHCAECTKTKKKPLDLLGTLADNG